MATQAGLKFLDFEIIKVLFVKNSTITNNKIEIEIKHITESEAKEVSDIFNTIFIINIKASDKSFDIQIQASGLFEIIGEVSEEIRDNYINISSPSIVYPYIRAFISNLTLQSGMKPIIIPPMNFYSK